MSFAQWLRPGKGAVTCRKPLQHHSGRALWLLPPPPALASGELKPANFGVCLSLMGMGETLGWVAGGQKRGNPRSVTVEDGVSPSGVTVVRKRVGEKDSTAVAG